MASSLLELETTSRPTSLRDGIFDLASLKQAVDSLDAQHYIVDGLLKMESLNILVGDSNLGKTPLAIMLALCVASDSTFLGMPTVQSSVLYCDAETAMPDFLGTLTALADYLELEIPDTFRVWSPNWDSTLVPIEASSSVGEKLINRVRADKPGLVVCDTLRSFWPLAETKSEIVGSLYREMRDISKMFGTTWLILHHRRKEHREVKPPDFDTAINKWMEESAGSGAILNLTDTRLGMVVGQGLTDVKLGGYVRGTGPLPTTHLVRSLDRDGVPRGYHVLTGLDALKDADKERFAQLPTTFAFKDVAAILGKTSGSNTQRFLTLCVKAGLIKKLPDNRGYEKMYGVSGVTPETS